MKPVGSTIRLWRIHRKLTQEALAERSGVSRPNLSAIEQGARDFYIATLRRIAAALETSPGTLVDGTGPAPTHAPLSFGRFSIDRIARLAAGERIQASPKEKRLALHTGPRPQCHVSLY